MPEFCRLIGARPLPRIHLLSDLHLETGPYAIPADLDYDVLVAAGDIGPVEQAVSWLASRGKPVVYVLGNHEFWGGEYADVLPAARAAAKGTRVHILEKSAVVIQGVRFLGTTLWTDYGSWDPSLVQEAIWRMRDYTRISARQWYDVKANLTWFRRHCLGVGMNRQAIEEVISERTFHPAIAYQAHQRSLAWLTRALRRPHDGPTVVVTHHAPTFDSLRAFGVQESSLRPENWGHRDDSLIRVAGYASRLDRLLQGYSDVIDLWAHGHLHSGIDVLTPGVRVVCNPRGYMEKPREKKGTAAFTLGHRVTQGDIERSQALVREQPYRGDAPDFDSALVIDLEQGYERPIRREIDGPLDALRKIRQDTAELVSRLRRTRGPNRQYLIRCLDHDLGEFNHTLDACLARIKPSLQRYRWDRLDDPVRLWSPFQDDLDDPAGFYSRSLERMKAWEAWLEALPTLAQAHVIDWARIGWAILVMLAEAGIEGRIEKLPATALRRVDALEHRIVVALNEEGRDEWSVKLERAFGGGVPRKHIISVWGLSDVSDDEDASLVTQTDLERVLRQFAPFPSCGVRTGGN